MTQDMPHNTSHDMQKSPMDHSYLTSHKARYDPQESQVVIFDTTLRDGEQSPGCSMHLEEKLKVALQLADMGVDVIEAGFPMASNGDFEAVSQIAAQIKGSRICALARANRRDIERAAEALDKAPAARIHTFISTSPLHMKYKLQMEPQRVLELIHESVSLARSYVEDVEWSAEDGSRTEPEFLIRCVEIAIAAGARTINIPDTVGYAVPFEYGALFALLKERAKGIEGAILSAHCHNDLGLAVANSLAALENGARQIECTINGLGERAGNAALEEIVMALRTRQDVLSYRSHIDSRQIMRASRLVSGITGMAVQANKAIVGANAFAHESGIHQDGMLKNAATYEIMTPESVGLNRSTLIMGKHSGRNALRSKVKDLGMDLGDNAFEDLFIRFKELADQKKHVYDEDIIALIDDQGGLRRDMMRLVDLKVSAGLLTGPNEAEISVAINGQTQKSSAKGNGPVDAIFNAIRLLVPHNAELKLYQVHAVTKGTDAQAEVTVRLEEDGRSVNAQGAHVDTLVASANAYLHALDKLALKRLKTPPSPMGV
jgi:2-isopropylmalate synthase